MDALHEGRAQRRRIRSSGAPQGPADQILTAFVLACGPSLTQQDVGRCRGRGEVIAVSDAHRFAPWADILYSCDAAWWRHHRGVPGFRGERIARQSFDLETLSIAQAPAAGEGAILSGDGGNSG